MRAFLPAVLLLSVFTSGAFAQETAPIKIGTNCTFEGQSGEMGVSMRAALRIAVAEINAVGGVGRPQDPAGRTR